MTDNRIPARILVVSHGDDLDAPKTPIGVVVDGQRIDWADAPVTRTDNPKALIYDGRPYRFAASAGYRPHPEGGFAFGAIFRLLQGWQVLISNAHLATGQTPVMVPAQPFPHQDRAEASDFARLLATRNKASLGSNLVCQIAWRDGDDLGEPVAELDAREHTRSEAAAALLAEQGLAWDWEIVQEDGPGDAPTSPGPESPEETDRDHDTMEPGTEQIVLCVIYESEGAAVQPAQLKTIGQLVEITDGDGNPIQPPAHSIAEIRLALQHQGYSPEYPAWEWLDRGSPPRRRREVWTRSIETAEAGPAWDVPSLRAGPHAPNPTPQHSEAVLARMAEAAERRAHEDPSRPDPFYRKTWTRSRGWDLGGSGIGG
jgi:hypothetical protein